MSYKIWVTKFESQIRVHKILVTKFELPNLSYQIWVTNCELQNEGILYYLSLHMFSMYYTFLQCIMHFSNVLQFIKQSKHQPNRTVLELKNINIKKKLCLLLMLWNVLLPHLFHTPKFSYGSHLYVGVIQIETFCLKSFEKLMILDSNETLIFMS